MEITVILADETGTYIDYRDLPFTNLDDTVVPIREILDEIEIEDLDNEQAAMDERKQETEIRKFIHFIEPPKDRLEEAKNKLEAILRSDDPQCSPCRGKFNPNHIK